ncbi:MAG: hypothetical protein LBB56_08370 [Chitinispirillales bacterium]|jgi:predicted nucleic acid-binding protein|nr:hypothetical protein [Chitinispirillales bacterium]
MKKMKIYLDTSTVSYLDAHDCPDKMQDTHKLWEEIKANKFEVFLSNTTLEELERSPEPKRGIFKAYLGDIVYTAIPNSAEIDEVARMIINMGILKPKSHDDCMHIASAVVAECDVIVSWNFRHMVNVKTVRGVRAISISQGYKNIDIVAPPSVLTENEEE